MTEQSPQIPPATLEPAVPAASMRARSRIGLWLLRSVMGLYFVFCATVLVLKYGVLPKIDQFRPDIEQTASQILGRRVTIEDVDAGWWGLAPQLTFKQLTLFDEQGRAALRLPQVTASLSWSSLTAFDLRLASLTITAPHLEIARDPQGVIWVAGLKLDPNKPDDHRGSDWLLSQHDIALNNVSLTWTDLQRGAPPLTLRDASLHMSNLVGIHKVALRGQMDQWVSEPIELQARFRTPFFSQHPSDPVNWRGEAYATLHGFDIQRLAPWFDVPTMVSTAAGSVRAWLNFEALKPTALTADIDMNHVALKLVQDKPELVLQEVKGRVQWEQTDTGMTVFSTQALTVLQEPHRVAGPLTASLQLNQTPEGRLQRGQLKTEQVELEPWVHLASFLPLEADLSERLAKESPKGLIKQLTVVWKGTYPNLSAWSVDTEFDKLSIGPSPSGIEGVSGKLTGDEKSGKYLFNGKQVRAHLPDLFEEPLLTFDQVDIKGGWQQDDKTPGVYKININDAQVANEDIALSLKGFYKRIPGQVGDADIVGKIKHGRIAGVPRYLPLVVGPDARAWLKQALKGGQADEGRFVLRGPLYDFPFDQNKKADFNVNVKFHDGALNYATGWPALDKIKGEAFFDRDTLTIKAQQAKVYDVALENVVAKIPRLSAAKPMLEVTGAGAGPLNDLIRFINTSPVSGYIDDVLVDAKAAGNAKLGLRLGIPLVELGNTTIKGQVTLQDGDLRIVPAMPWVQKAKGTIEFSEKDLQIKNIVGQALGGDVKVAGNSRQDGSLLIKADGDLTGIGLRRFLDHPVGNSLNGKSRYAVTVSVKKKVPDILIESSLVGMEVTLPPPFRKLPADPWPLEIRNQPLPASKNGLSRDELRVQWASPAGPLMQARLERQFQADKSVKVERGVVAVGDTAKMPDKGFNLIAKVPLLNVDAWRDILNSSVTPGGKDIPFNRDSASANREAAFPMPDRIDASANEVLVSGKRFSKVALSANRNQAVWAGDLTADEAQGNFVWNQGAAGSAGSLSARLTRLVIPPSATSELSEVMDNTASDIPALDIVVDNFTLKGHPLGRLTLKALNEGSGAMRSWNLDTLQIQNDEARLSAKGLWTRLSANAVRKTDLTFDMTVTDAGKLLERLGQNKVFRRGKGSLSGTVSWAGSPLSMDFPSLSGKLKLDTQDGQFLKAEPGVAKLLGVLSLQSLPRRITLDFRDVFSEGFAFDTVQANVEINKGIANTKDFKMKGVAATVLIEGQADLDRETQNLRVLVLPDVNAAGGSLVYSVLAANPAIGLATFVAQLLLKDPLAKALSFEYDITGLWSDPNVKRVERKLAADNKADGG